MLTGLHTLSNHILNKSPRVEELPWKSFGLQDHQTSQSYKKSVLIICWKDMLKLKLQYFGHLMRRTNSLERPWRWERLRAGGEGDNRGWDGWMPSTTWRTWVWASSGSWWWTGKPGVLQSMGSQRVRHNWVTELNLEEVLLTLSYRWKQGGRDLSTNHTILKLPWFKKSKDGFINILYRVSLAAVGIGLFAIQAQGLLLLLLKI